MNNFAHLKKDSPWYPIFERGLAPIKNWLLPERGNMIGGGGEQDFYSLDLDRCTDEQRDKIFTLLAQRAGCSVAEARAGVEQQGKLPLRAIHVNSVSSDCPAFL